MRQPRLRASPLGIRSVKIVSLAVFLIIGSFNVSADDEEGIINRTREIVAAYQTETSKAINEQSSKTLEQIKKRLDPLWNPLARLALKDKAAEMLKERLYEISAGVEQRILELRKFEAERERAELVRLARERQDERRRRGDAPTWSEPLGFRDIPFGTSPIAVATLLPDLHCGIASCSGRINIGVVSVFATLDFRSEGFDAVGLSFDSGSFVRMKAIFLERYGPPTSRKLTPTQNRLGAQFENEELEWSGPEVRIRLKRFGSSFDKGWASIQTQKRVKADADMFRQEILRGKKDL